MNQELRKPFEVLRRFLEPVTSSLTWIAVLAWFLLVLAVTALVELRQWNPRKTTIRRVKQNVQVLPSPVVKTAAGIDVLHVRLSSLQVAEVKRLLTRTDAESMCIIVGVLHGIEWFATSIAPLPLARATVNGVTADLSLAHEKLLEIEQYGHVVLVVMHSHPGQGAQSVRESSIDRQAQHRYEIAGYRSLTGIVSRDGYVRFFTNNITYKLDIHGNGIQQISEGLYRLNS